MGGAFDLKNILLVKSTQQQRQTPNDPELEALEEEQVFAEQLKLNPLSQAFDPENTTLVVDDCSFNIVATKSLLRQLGTDADSLAHSRALLPMLRQRDAEGLPMYRLILLDFSMPDFDGPKCARIIRDFARERGL